MVYGIYMVHGYRIYIVHGYTIALHCIAWSTLYYMVYGIYIVQMIQLHCIAWSTLYYMEDGI
jgi:hypothetical protein